MMRRTSSTAVVAAVVAFVVAALPSCSSDSPDGSPAEGRPGVSGSGSPAPDPTPPPSPSPSPSPTGPCADGRCEIQVAVGDVVTVPETYGLGPIEVTAITGRSVEMVAPLTGSGYSVAGCSGGGGVSSKGSGGVGLRCDEGTAATINDAMSLEVVKVLAAAAVLRIEPAG